MGKTGGVKRTGAERKGRGACAPPPQLQLLDPPVKAVATLWNINNKSYIGLLLQTVPFSTILSDAEGHFSIQKAL